MTTSFNRALFDQYVADHRERFLTEFAEFIAIPSVAAENRSIEPMAQLLTERLTRIGAKATAYPIPNGSPVVYAELRAADPNAPTLMIYNHYDVQPEVPLDLWESPPFELTRKDGVLYGRGTSDDKGELLARIQAVEAWLATHGSLPVNLKWVVEGEEEISSLHLPEWVDAHRDLLTADGLLWEGGGYDESGRYKIAAGCKGIAYFEFHVDGPKMDLHSSYAPISPNPAWRLIWALNTLKDANDHILIDGYDQHVAPPSAELIAWLKRVPIDDLPKLKSYFGLTEWLGGRDDQEAYIRLMTEPTVTICGIETGYIGKGPKTVLPAHAYAKVDCRLVPNLTPPLVHKLLREHLDKRGFTDIEIRLLGGEEPADSPANSRIERASVKAGELAWGKTPLSTPRVAGSGPMHALSTHLGIATVTAGATWHPNARPHSPNENILEKDYFDTMRFMGALLATFALES
jgi:acetylornithine deacetylase/succinyl-diaminopimelate desuccinylase-like protein